MWPLYSICLHLATSSFHAFVQIDYSICSPLMSCFWKPSGVFIDQDHDLILSCMNFLNNHCELTKYHSLANAKETFAYILAQLKHSWLSFWKVANVSNNILIIYIYLHSKAFYGWNRNKNIFKGCNDIKSKQYNSNEN